MLAPGAGAVLVVYPWGSQEASSLEGVLEASSVPTSLILSGLPWRGKASALGLFASLALPWRVTQKCIV